MRLYKPHRRRLEAIERRLKEGDIVKGDQLAAIAGCDIRTVYRYIAYLRSTGIRIDSDAGVGYQLSREHRYG